MKLRGANGNPASYTMKWPKRWPITMKRSNQETLTARRLREIAMEEALVTWTYYYSNYMKMKVIYTTLQNFKTNSPTPRLGSNWHSNALPNRKFPALTASPSIDLYKRLHKRFNPEEPKSESTGGFRRHILLSSRQHWRNKQMRKRLPRGWPCPFYKKKTVER